MSILDRMLDEMELQHKRASALTKVLGINSSVFSTWKKYNRNPPSEYIFHICEFLNVSFEWLLTGQGVKHPQATEDATPSIWALQDYQRQAAEEYYANLTDEQVTLLDNYEKLTLPNRREMQGIIQLKLATQLDGQLEGRAQGGTA